MESKKEIITRIMKISGSKSPYDVFCDWIKCMALSISNATTMIHGRVWKAREEEYLNTINRDPRYKKEFPEMFKTLVRIMDNEIGDILGEIYMESGCGNNYLKKIGTRAGVVNAHAHRFRRTGATFALRRGMPIIQVSKILGHEQLDTTQIYLDISEKELENAHEKYVV